MKCICKEYLYFKAKSSCPKSAYSEVGTEQNIRMLTLYEPCRALCWIRMADPGQVFLICMKQDYSNGRMGAQPEYSNGGLGAAVKSGLLHGTTELAPLKSADLAGYMPLWERTRFNRRFRDGNLIRSDTLEFISGGTLTICHWNSIFEIWACSDEEAVITAITDLWRHLKRIFVSHYNIIIVRVLHPKATVWLREMP